MNKNIKIMISVCSFLISAMLFTTKAQASTQMQRLSGQDNHSLYKMDIDGSNVIKLTNDESYYINIFGDRIYYKNNSDNGSMYSIKIDGTDRKKVTDELEKIAPLGCNLLYN